MRALIGQSQLEDQVLTPRWRVETLNIQETVIMFCCSQCSEYCNMHSDGYLIAPMNGVDDDGHCDYCDYCASVAEISLTCSQSFH